MGVVRQRRHCKLATLAKIAKYLRITYDNWKDGSKFLVYGNTGDVMEFVESKTGLYYHDVSNKKDITQKGIVLVDTVK